MAWIKKYLTECYFLMCNKSPVANSAGVVSAVDIRLVMTIVSEIWNALFEKFYRPPIKVVYVHNNNLIFTKPNLNTNTDIFIIEYRAYSFLDG